jgi:hypothetical protein
MDDIHPSWGQVTMPMLVVCQWCGEEQNVTNLLGEDAQFFSNVHLDCTER